MRSGNLLMNRTNSAEKHVELRSQDTMVSNIDKNMLAGTVPPLGV